MNKILNSVNSVQFCNSVKKSSKGFTLIEVLLAITIVAILSSLAMPAFHMAMNASKKSEAAATMASIKMALIQYKTEYGDWPAAIQDCTNNTGDIVLGFGAGESKWGELYRALSSYSNDPHGYIAANGTTNNSRKLLFLEIPQSALDDADISKTQNILDPWNHPYQLVVDANGDYKVDVPNLKNQTLELLEIVSTIAIWSTGSKPDSPAKYIGTWK